LTPAVPVRSLVENDWQVLSGPVLEILPQTSLNAVFLPAQSISRRLVSVPLYQRNCSYLL